MKTLFIFSVVLLQALSFTHALDFAKTAEQRAEEMLSQMNLTEKLTMMAGYSGSLYTGTILANERLGIPVMYYQDGPQGFRTDDNTGGYGTTTQWPSALTMASSWDRDLLNSWAAAMAEEFKGKGVHVALGPGMGVARCPLGGRNFEYLCGEDPSFCSFLVKEVVDGFQKNGIMANAKHYINNEIEIERQQMSANVNERVRFELYYPPFAAAADAGVLSVMCSYNRINDVYACENSETLTHLREYLGFKGWVMSDWWATQSTVASVNAGLDQEMPYNYYYDSVNMTDALAAGKINEKQIDQSVLRILTAMYSIGMFDKEPVGDRNANVTSDEHNRLAREYSAKSTVMLKNVNKLLPLNKASLGACLAVIGDELTVGGGGSGSVVPPYVITPKQGFLNALAKDYPSTQVLFANGFDLDEATALAKSCSNVVVVVATSSGEGWDRETLSLGEQQDNLVSAVAAVNANTIVAVRTPGAVLMPWINEVSAVLVQWMPGQEAGNALADIVFGVYNPYARLPVSFPNKDNEVGFTQEQYPGVGTPPEASYTEELLIGYRWYNAMNVKPLFPFGHGLSFTSFAYSNLHMKVYPGSADDSIIAQISLDITNTGSVAGSEIVQVYVGYPSEAGEPPKQLRNFGKIDVKPSFSRSITLTLTKRDISIWNSEKHAWEALSGSYKVHIGSSSENIHVQTTINWN